MKLIVKRMVFVIFSLVYWYGALSFVSLLLYASICHYPDVPGCKTDLTWAGLVMLLAVGFYVLVVYAFRKWTKNDPRGGYR